MASISTAMFPGSGPMPTALRAPTPRSGPHTSANSSLQPLITLGCSKKSGAEFDQCYMFGQVMAHMGMVDALTVFAKHASPEFRQKLDKALQTTKRHLAEAQQIAESLEGTHHRSNAKSTEG